MFIATSCVKLLWPHHPFPIVLVLRCHVHKSIRRLLQHELQRRTPPSNKPLSLSLHPETRSPSCSSLKRYNNRSIWANTTNTGKHKSSHLFLRRHLHSFPHSIHTTITFLLTTNPSTDGGSSMWSFLRSATEHDKCRSQQWLDWTRHEDLFQAIPYFWSSLFDMHQESLEGRRHHIEPFARYQGYKSNKLRDEYKGKVEEMGKSTLQSIRQGKRQYTQLISPQRMQTSHTQRTYWHSLYWLTIDHLANHRFRFYVYGYDGKYYEKAIRAPMALSPCWNMQYLGTPSIPSLSNTSTFSNWRFILYIWHGSCTSVDTPGNRH